MKLSDKIYACRTRAKLSQEELAEQVGVSRQAVSRWECGDNVPEPSKLLMLARLFGVTADWLLDDAQEMPAEPHKEEAKQPWVDSLVENCKSLAGKFDRMLDECIPADKKEEQEADNAEPTPPPEPEAAPTADAPQDEVIIAAFALFARCPWHKWSHPSPGRIIPKEGCGCQENRPHDTQGAFWCKRVHFGAVCAGFAAPYNYVIT